ncbi:bis-aminopropyl spermidine synthase family protein [Desulfofundulus sp. TPOSR]|uniref:bis-aminopropyl spermidine synthase family protein n=1 Tax=Desulfofundulus sp. TPOSR TaxID=2714340 RepID=UPI00140CDFFE|nr:bis-aminopropyl spermidine synthase family protein [Desulfofundulus sp. TPOSR]NHM27412.1 bis-aminopropyl spermidine synthase family protein [Desulfofundulus sp. TPOSR]
MLNRTQKQIFRALMAKPSTFWELIKEQDGHLAHFTQVMEEMLALGLVRYEGSYIYLTDKGKEEARGQGLSPLQPLTCPTCGGKTVTFQGSFPRVLREFAEIVRQRPAAIAEFDQGYVDTMSTVARVAIMYQRGDLENQDILLIGDDDLTSIAIALTGMARHITVLEVDDRLVEFIDLQARKKGWTNLSVHRYDVRHPLPREFQGQYDTFLIDPVETLPGIRLFLSRCALSLRGKGSAGYFGLTHLEASRDKWYFIQRLILDMNFVITDIIHNFQEYELEREGFVSKNYPLVQRAFGPLPVPDTNWYTSNFFRLEAVAKPRVPEQENIPTGREFYFDDEAYATLP